MKIVDTNGVERECVKAVPDPQYPGYVKVYFKSKIRKGYSHEEWYPIEEFKKNNPKLIGLVKGSDGSVEEDLGVVTGATEKTLVDKSKKWKKNIFAEYPIWISRGTGEGQTREVTSNTKNSVTIDKSWDMVPDKSSQFVISHNIHDPQVLGNTLSGIVDTKSPSKIKKKGKK